MLSLMGVTLSTRAFSTQGRKDTSEWWGGLYIVLLDGWVRCFASGQTSVVLIFCEIAMGLRACWAFIDGFRWQDMLGNGIGEYYLF